MHFVHFLGGGGGGLQRTGSVGPRRLGFLPVALSHQRFGHAAVRMSPRPAAPDPAEAAVFAARAVARGPELDPGGTLHGRRGKMVSTPGFGHTQPC